MHTAQAATQTIHIPAREARAAKVPKGKRFQVVDLEGQQCADLFAFCVADLKEYHSAEHTRVYNDRLFPKPGEYFVTNKRRPILYFEADETPGKHDMLVAACDPFRYQGLGVEGWHASCQENLEKAMEALGQSDIEIPQPINLFTNIPVRADGVLCLEPALTKPGDSVTLRSEMDAYIVVSSCPQDITAINARHPGPLELRLLT
jgi:uncharacterized protein YcgI (DUF1989 family)